MKKEEERNGRLLVYFEGTINSSGLSFTITLFLSISNYTKFTFLLTPVSDFS